MRLSKHTTEREAIESIGRNGPGIYEIRPPVVVAVNKPDDITTLQMRNSVEIAWNS